MVILLFIFSIIIQTLHLTLRIVIFTFERLHYLSPLRYDKHTRAEKRTKAIDQALWEDSKVRGRRNNVLPLGAFSMREIIRQLKTRNEADAAQSHNGVQGVSEHQFETNGVVLNFIDVGHQRCERRKWIHQFDNIAAILYVVDLSCYDEELSSGNALSQQIEVFDSVINSKRFPKTVFTLFLSNVSGFRQKLAHSPLENHFPGYTGGTNANEAEEFLRQRFRRVNRSQRRLYEHFVDPYDTANIQLVSVA